MNVEGEVSRNGSSQQNKSSPAATDPSRRYNVAPPKNVSPAKENNSMSIAHKASNQFFKNMHTLAHFKLTDEKVQYMECLYRREIALQVPTPAELGRLDFLRKDLKNLKTKLQSCTIIDEVGPLGIEIDELQDEVSELENTIKMANTDICDVKYVSSKAKQCLQYWLNDKKKAQTASKWRIVCLQATHVLRDVLNPPKDPDVVEIEESKEDGNETNTNNITVTDANNVASAPRGFSSNFTAAELANLSRKRKFLPPTKGPAKTKSAKAIEIPSEQQFLLYLNGGSVKKDTGMPGPSLKGEGLSYIRSVGVKCGFCNKLLNNVRRLDRHCATKSHKKNKNNAGNNIKMIHTTLETIEANREENEAGGSLPAAVKAHRQQALREICKACVPVTAFKSMSKWIDSISQIGISIGDAKMLPVLYATSLQLQLEGEIKTVLKDCFSEYGLTFDGTASFAKAEAIKYRGVTLEFEIVELLLHVELYKDSLSGNNLAANLAIAVEKNDLEFEAMRTVQKDRAATNGKALNDMRAVQGGPDPTEFDCNSHTLSNTGSKLIEKDNAKYCESFRKKYQGIIQYPGNARSLAKQKYGEEVREAGGVRFCRHLEQVMQFHKFGLENVVIEIAIPCKDRKWSEKSAKKLIAAFGTEETKSDLAMAILESAVVSDVGLHLTIACYSLEGDDPLILSAFKTVLAPLMLKMEVGFHLPSLLFAAEKSAALLEAALVPFQNRLMAAVTKLHEAHTIYVEAEEEHEASVDVLEEYDKPKGRDGVRRQTNKRAHGYNENIQRMRAEIDRLLEPKNAAKKKIRRIEKVEEIERKNMEALKAKFPHRTVEELVEYGKRLTRPAIDYFKKHWTKEDGALYHVQMSARACQFLDPLQLRELSIDELELLVDELRHFKFKEFTPAFLVGVKIELKRAKEEALKEFDFESMPRSRRYETRLDRAIKRRKLQDDHDFDWKKDPGERAHKIWEWWKLRMIDNPDFSHIRKCIRLVVLAQLSSCSVERIFSQMQQIRDAVGDNLFSEMAKNYMYLRCNGDLDVYRGGN